MDIDKLFKVLYAHRSVPSFVYIEETSGTKNPHRGKQTAHARCTNTRDAQEDETCLRGRVHHHIHGIAATFHRSFQASCVSAGC
jgi:hypothetical protein